MTDPKRDAVERALERLQTNDDEMLGDEITQDRRRAILTDLAAEITQQNRRELFTGYRKGKERAEARLAAVVEWLGLFVEHDRGASWRELVYGFNLARGEGIESGDDLAAELATLRRIVTKARGAVRKALLHVEAETYRAKGEAWEFSHNIEVVPVSVIRHALATAKERDSDD